MLSTWVIEREAISRLTVPFALRMTVHSGRGNGRLTNERCQYPRLLTCHGQLHFVLRVLDRTIGVGLDRRVVRVLARNLLTVGQNRARPMSPYCAPASRKNAWRIASTLTMGMPQTVASTARRSSARWLMSSTVSVIGSLVVCLAGDTPQATRPDSRLVAPLTASGSVARSATTYRDHLVAHRGRLHSVRLQSSGVFVVYRPTVSDQPTDASVPKPDRCHRTPGLPCGFGIRYALT